MEPSESWSESQVSFPHMRRFETRTPKGKNTAIVRKMDNGDEPGAVVRELWVAGEPLPMEFLTDAEFEAAIQAANLPAIGIEAIRRSVAATMNKHFI